MATCYRTSGRTKSSNAKIVIPNQDSIWESFKAERQKTSIESMNRNGWKTLQQVADMVGMSRPHINSMANNGKFEVVKRKVYHCGKTRDLTFVKPKI